MSTGKPDDAPAMKETVDHPAHYQAPNDPAGTYEAINVIEAYGLGWKAGSALKYVLRYREKGSVEDLRKAVWCLNRLIEKGGVE